MRVDYFEGLYPRIAKMIRTIGNEIQVFSLSDIVNENVKRNAYNTIKRLSEYVYYTEYDALDYKYGMKAIADRFPLPMACSSVRNGNFYGRNLDFYFNRTVEMITKVKGGNGRFATIGVVGCMDEINADFCASEVYDDIYKLAPFQIVDGINEKGVIANINVVPAGDRGFTTGSVPAVEKKETICGAMLVRYILDNFATAKEAVEYIRDYVSVYAPAAENLHFEYHYMVADANDTYIVEFVENTCSVINVNNRPWMTNLYVTDAIFDENNHLSYVGSNLTPCSAGLERSNLIADNYGEASTLAGMTDLMVDKLRYTKTYEFGKYEPFWYTEFCGGELTLEAIEYARDQVDPYVAYYSSDEFWDETHKTRRDDIHGTWETSHTSIYDIEKRELNLYAKEMPKKYTFKLQ